MSDKTVEQATPKVFKDAEGVKVLQGGKSPSVEAFEKQLNEQLGQ